MQTRRIVAVIAIIVVVVLVAVLVHSCEVSQGTDSLKSYAANVDTLMAHSGDNGASLFSDLESGELSSSSGEATLQTHLNTLLHTASSQRRQAQELGAPGQLSSAQSALVQVMELREQAIGIIANNIQATATTSTSAAAIGQIAEAMYMLSGSDVTYKTFVAPKLAQALNGASIPVGGTSGAQIYAGQIMGDLGWLNPTTVGARIKANLPASVLNKAVPGKSQGHELNYVTVGGTQLSTVSLNTVAASPTPTFTLNFANSGQTPEYRVECIVKVDTVSDEGVAIVKETLPNQTYTCNVKLPSKPPSSYWNVTATIKPVPGETNVANNTQTFKVDFN